MLGKLFVIGTFDQDVSALPAVDLMRCLVAAGVPPAGVIFKRSLGADNPPRPVLAEAASGCSALHVNDFNNPEVVARVAALQPDLLVYAGGRDLLRPPLLSTARLGCLGGHYGRLPEVRGMGTVEWSVIIGEPPAVAIQRISRGIDTGDIVMQARVPLTTGDNFAAIRDRSYYMTKVMLAVAAKRVLVDGITGTPQQGAAGRQFFRLHPALQQMAERALQRHVTGLRDDWHGHVVPMVDLDGAQHQ